MADNKSVEAIDILKRIVSVNLIRSSQGEFDGHLYITFSCLENVLRLIFERCIQYNCDINVSVRYDNNSLNYILSCPPAKISCLVEALKSISG